MAEGRPRETLVQYDVPMEAPIGDEKGLSQRGLPGTVSNIKRSCNSQEITTAAARVKASL